MLVQKALQGFVNGAGVAKTFVGVNAPHILFAVGVAGAVGSVASAIVATLDVEKDIDEWKKDKAASEALIEKYKEDGHTEEEVDEYTKRHHFTVTSRFFRRLAKRYALPAVLLVLSIVCLTASHYILNDSLVKTASALAAANQSKQLLEGRIVQDPEGGEDKLIEHKYGLKPLQVDGPQYDEYGNPIAEPVRWYSEDDPKQINMASPYARVVYDIVNRFDPLNPTSFLSLATQIDDALTFKAKDRAVFLNEAYELHGLHPSEWSMAGQEVGWPKGSVIKTKVIPLFYKNGNGGQELAYVIDFDVKPIKHIVFDRKF